MDIEAGSHAQRSGSPTSGRRDRRAEIVRRLRESADATVAELAEVLDVHPNTVRFHLTALERSGDVVRVRQTPHTPGRPELRFRLAPAAEPATDRVDLLARILLTRIAEAEDPTTEAEAAGRHWGSAEAERTASAEGHADAVEDLIGMLEESGFAPARRGRDRIDLLSCPLRQFLATHGTLVCSIHRGMMAGFLEGTQSLSTVDSLEPFATATSCRTRLQTRS